MCSPSPRGSASMQRVNISYRFLSFRISRPMLVFATCRDQEQYLVSAWFMPHSRCFQRVSHHPFGSKRASWLLFSISSSIVWAWMGSSCKLRCLGKFWIMYWIISTSMYIFVLSLHKEADFFNTKAVALHFWKEHNSLLVRSLDS